MFDIFLCIWYTIFMKKDMFTINKNGLSYGRGYVYSLQYHLVWCTKYRKKVLKDGIDVECKEMLESLAQEYKFQILANLRVHRNLKFQQNVYNNMRKARGRSTSFISSLKHGYG